MQREKNTHDMKNHDYNNSNKSTTNKSKINIDSFGNVSQFHLSNLEYIFFFQNWIQIVFIVIRLNIHYNSQDNFDFFGARWVSD